eukprot:8971728-Pyramimonas_sp.AAC.1
MALHSGIPSRGEPSTPPPWAQTGLAHICKEHAILCLCAAQWRATQGGISTVTTNYDGTRAFAATSRALQRAI